MRVLLVHIVSAAIAIAAVAVVLPSFARVAGMCRVRLALRALVCAAAGRVAVCAPVAIRTHAAAATHGTRGPCPSVSSGRHITVAMATVRPHISHVTHYASRLRRHRTVFGLGCTVFFPGLLVRCRAHIRLGGRTISVCRSTLIGHRGGRR